MIAKRDEKVEDKIRFTFNFLITDDVRNSVDMQFNAWIAFKKDNGFLK